MRHTPDVNDALYTGYEGVEFDDPGSEELPHNPGYIGAAAFLVPVQNEVLNLIAKLNVIEQDGEASVRVRLAMSNAAIYGASQFH